MLSAVQVKHGVRMLSFTSMDEHGVRFENLLEVNDMRMCVAID
jgi:hypothetical protein